MAKDDLQSSHNAGQRDGANGTYTGTLFSGRNYEEQKAYNEGHEHGKETVKNEKSK